MSSTHPPTLGVVLAGGLARRMGGGDKWRIQIGRFTILDRLLDRLRPQCDNIVFNSNSDPPAAPHGLTVITDSVPGYPGPLAGILAGLDWAAQNAPAIGWLVSVPGDCPFLPRDLVARLHAARSESQAALACAEFGRAPPSDRRALADPVAGRVAPSDHRRADAGGSPMDRAISAGRRRMDGRAGRSILQRQYARGCRGSGGAGCALPGCVTINIPREPNKAPAEGRLGRSARGRALRVPPQDRQRSICLRRRERANRP